ncbi:putative transcription factor TIFY family [Medicago truncatula]|uniref:Protein TIFY n=1 Tax=Medicago truncatula TaxID=3880 RepID=G7JS78_MEDTR|nr:protein TIFY 10A [Medicago truncatula]AES92176.1 jasmonate zim-domain protein [Medicago truncatula]RHN64549.1 putative transcription factor TIFY family [Medicago truncatula]
MSTSSDISGLSGNKLTKSSEKPTFSQTCNLLRQYLKEKKGSFEGFNLHTPETNGSSPGSSSHSGITMDLFPTNVTPKNLTTMDFFFPRVVNPMVKEPETAQLTMFYNGQVIVLDDFPAEKVEELKSFARTQTQHSDVPTMIPQQPPSLIDMPIARKASLRRFMEKRKDRVSVYSPYQRICPDSAAPEKHAESAPWLVLGAKST